MTIEINGTAVGQTSDAALADQAGVGFVVPAEGRAEFDQIIGSTGQISSVPATTAPATTDESSPTSTTDDTADESSPTSTTDDTADESSPTSTTDDT